MPKVKQTKVRQRSKARDLRKDELIEMMQDFKVSLTGKETKHELLQLYNDIVGKKDNLTPHSEETTNQMDINISGSQLTPHASTSQHLSVSTENDALPAATSDLNLDQLATVIAQATVKALTPILTPRVEHVASTSATSPINSTTSLEHRPDHNALMSSKGVPLHTLPHVPIVPEKLRRDIVAGKNINLALLLTPSFSDNPAREIVIGDAPATVKSVADHHINRALNIQEFIQAFTVYKHVITQIFPSRLDELDKYLFNIVQMSNQFAGSLFYEYH